LPGRSFAEYNPDLHLLAHSAADEAVHGWSTPAVGPPFPFRGFDFSCITQPGTLLSGGRRTALSLRRSASAASRAAWSAATYLYTQLPDVEVSKDEVVQSLKGWPLHARSLIPKHEEDAAQAVSAEDKDVYGKPPLLLTQCLFDCLEKDVASR